MKRGFLINSGTPKQNDACSNKQIGQTVAPRRAAAESDVRPMLLSFGSVEKTKLPASYVPQSIKPLIWSDISSARQTSLNHDRLVVTRLPENGSVCLITKHVRNLVVNHPGFPRDVQQNSTPVYRIGQTQDKGLGMFATRKILRGEFVLDERPLVFLPRSARVGNVQWYSEGQIMQIMKYEMERVFEIAVDQMTDDEKKDLMALQNIHTKDGSGPILGIQRTNGFAEVGELQDKGQIAAGYGVVFKEASRINHSCSPNVLPKWDTASFSMKFCVKREIELGEEITTSPGNFELTLPAAERRKWLSPYGFKCTCHSCLHPEVSDSRRQLIHQIKPEDPNSLWAWAADPSLPDDLIIRKYVDGLKLCEEEGLESHPAYGICAGMLATCYMMLADAENSVKYIRMELISAGAPSEHEQFQMTRSPEVFTAGIEASTYVKKMWGQRREIQKMGSPL
ncbi:hypothetical protein C8J56DRAFT_1132397 [Mycena floridula]|nr:hypothetical protein C8J56DRAFT_1132397 [Mycena floridula]